MQEPLEKIQEQIEEKAQKRVRKKRPKMKVSGKSVFGLKKNIQNTDKAKKLDPKK